LGVGCQFCSIADPVSETGLSGYSRGLHEEFAPVLRSGLVADPPDDPVLVEAVPEFEQRDVKLCDGAEAPQPEQLLL
jgi:hypothetical protein